MTLSFPPCLHRSLPDRPAAGMRSNMLICDPNSAHRDLPWPVRVFTPRSRLSRVTIAVPPSPCRAQPPDNRSSAGVDRLSRRGAGRPTSMPGPERAIRCAGYRQIGHLASLAPSRRMLCAVGFGPRPCPSRRDDIWGSTRDRVTDEVAAWPVEPKRCPKQCPTGGRPTDVPATTARGSRRLPRSTSCQAPWTRRTSHNTAFY